MCRLPPSEQSVRDMLGTSVSPDVTVTRVKPYPSLQPQRRYQVDLSDNTILHLVLPPLSMWRPLRAEQAIVSTEATAVSWLRQTLARNPSLSNSPGSSQPSLPSLSSTAGKQQQQQIQNSETMLQLLPTLSHHGQDTTTPLREQFAFYEPSKGTAVGLLDPEIPDDLHSVERQQLDFELGGFYRRLFTQPNLVSPSGRFGPLAAVIPLLQLPQQQHQRTAQHQTGGLFGTSGAASWSMAFHSMLEGVLRDGEDMAVVLGYSSIRRHFRRLGYLLDDVTVARLVVVDAAEDENVLVERTLDTGVRIRGLQSWAGCVFGDPLFATVFSDPRELPVRPPSEGFLRGVNDSMATMATEGMGDWLEGMDTQIVEGKGSAGVRLLFYQVYHVLTRIVAEFYRPRPDSTARELEARRKLNVILGRLAEVPDGVLGPGDSHYSSYSPRPSSSSSSSMKTLGNKREHGVARPSGEMSPAKRMRELELPVPKK
ncbi:hypothetical protein QBC40DRAFT_321613 [Triangularia verruculosa]|uniref:Uncharacterized protein n=1 Tax=Triangularia verruculosa TaxID=2587418 RepID=A0AAN6X5M1_9PEZI|nr:hypothetical protein QBC40DRAFT_321613 [Triangularia verruculosa]